MDEQSKIPLMDECWYTFFGNLLQTSDKSFMGKEGAEIMADEVKKAWDSTSESEELSKEINLIGIRMGLFAHGSDFFIDNGFPVELWERYEESRVKALAKAAAKVLHLEDETPLIYAATRTEEQQRVMMEISGREQITRLKTYMASNYFKSIGLFIDAFAEALHVEKEAVYKLEAWDDISDACAYLNRYFYALHKDINPAAEAALTDENREEIKAIINKLIAYKEEHGGGYFDSIAPCFRLTGVDAEKITEITQQDFFGLPLSKVWREQGIIATEGAAGRDINVGKKTSSGAVIVQASISGKDGEALSIDEVQKGVQRAIGNLIYEAGGKSKLPIIVTPQQIYRAYARLPLNATVSQQQAEEMERAMDVLMYAPASLNFTAQLEKHKHIKQQPDYDYQSEQSGRLSSTLIQAQKLEAEARDGSRNIAYKIYDIPVLYLYSHAINQIAWVPNALLTSGEKPPIKTTETRDAKGTARNVAMRENVLTRVLRMKERQKQKERYTALLRVDEIAADCGITLTDKIRRTLLKNMALYLDELKEQKQIKGYSEKKEGRKIAGYTVNP